MSAGKWRVAWDNGASACGVFPYEFDTEAEAQTLADDWAAEMNATDPRPEGDESDGYTAEPVQVQP